MNTFCRHLTLTASALVALSLAPPSLSQGKPATDTTKQTNQAVLEQLPFHDKQDFEDAKRGFIGKPEKLIIKGERGNVVWDMARYQKFLGQDQAAPDTVNPSLWRNSQLNVQYGLYEVTDRIYQVRGYDLSNMTLIEGDTGWIILDPLMTVETASAAMQLVEQHLGEKPVVAVIYSHSHIDHFGGVKGVVDEADVDAGKVQIIAPEGFMEHAISENIIAGNAMSRRATFQYGIFQPRSPTGNVGLGLGMSTALGITTLIEPTKTMKDTGSTLTVDGIEMVFQMTPGAEAPAEMNTYFPQFNAMWMAENTTNVMHNILTLRGAPVRDALAWAKYIDEAIQLYGDKIQIKFQSHHWPVWGNERIIEHLKKQRDLYKFIHDQSVRLMNQGYTGKEIAEIIELPPELANFWPGRGYYGTLRHNARAIYQRYMGWYDANPSNLNPLPPEAEADKYVQYMGGAEAILKKAQQDFADGQYRWVATVLRHLVFAEPEHQTAKLLLADAYEQLGYQAEAGPWRSIYLQGALELRTGTPNYPVDTTASPDTLAAMPLDLMFDYLAVRLNSDKAAGKVIKVNMVFTDLDKTYGLTVENAVLNHRPQALDEADVTLTLTREGLNQIQLGQTDFKQEIQSGAFKVDGDGQTLFAFFNLFDEFELWFNIVTP